MATHIPPPQGLISSAFGEVTMQTHLGVRREWDNRKLRKYGLGAAAVVGIAGSLCALVAAGNGRSTSSRALRTSAAVIGCLSGQLMRQCLDAAGTNPAIEAFVAHVKDVSETTVVEGKAATTATESITQPAHIVRNWVDKAYANFGRRLEDTKADRDALGFWLARQMKEADVRDRDIAVYLPSIVECCLLPGYAEMIAQEIRNSRMARMLKSTCPLPKG